VDIASKQAWFSAQPAPLKILFLLEIMHELTLVLRDVSTTANNDLMWKSAWTISECNHRLLGYATVAMTQQPHYPDDVIIEILFDHLRHGPLEPYAQNVWDRAVERTSTFGAHLSR